MKISHIKEEVKVLVESSDKYSTRKIQGNIIIGKVSRALDKVEEDQALVSELRKRLYKEPAILEYHKFDENLYIVKTTKEEYWYTIDLRRSRSESRVSYTYESQLLITFALKYDGANSQFSDFAARMLGGDFLKIQEEAYEKANEK